MAYTYKNQWVCRSWKMKKVSILYNKYLFFNIISFHENTVNSMVTNNHKDQHYTVKISDQNSDKNYCAELQTYWFNIELKCQHVKFKGGNTWRIDWF